jgi:colanic acid biosynthesis glycosyl transferase WcaI
VVMHAGNIGLSQNLDIVLDAAERLAPHDGIRFVLVGDGSKRAALEARARERQLTNVTFMPYQPRVEMAKSYASADLFLVSLKPGLAGYIVPSKLYSILAAGRPYVACVEEACEVVEITRRYRCGVVVAPGDADALAARILQVYNDGPLAAELGQRAREAGLAFDRPRQVARYAALLRRVVGEEPVTDLTTPDTQTPTPKEIDSRPLPLGVGSCGDGSLHRGQ